MSIRTRSRTALPCRFAPRIPCPPSERHRTGVGRRGVVAIERETERSGSIHTKGVLVLDGFLNGTFAHSQPLAFNASLTFEQSYGDVEGDSASSAELYAILIRSRRPSEPDQLDPRKLLENRYRAP